MPLLLLRVFSWTLSKQFPSQSFSFYRLSPTLMSSELANHTWSLLKNSEVLDVIGLSESAHQSFKTLNSWYSAERKQQSALVVKTTDEIVHGSERYFNAITASIEMAQTGSQFADQAAALSQRLTENKTMSARDFRASVASMLKTANKASKQAQAMESKFGEVRTGLIRVAGNVQSRLAEVGVSQINAVGSPSTTQAAASKGEVVVVKKSSSDAQMNLSRAQGDLDGLLMSVSHFCNWWSNMVTKLGVIEAIVPDTEFEGFDTFLGTNVRERWADVGGKYDLYVQRIKLIEQIHDDLVRAQKKNRTNKFSALMKRSGTAGRKRDSSDTGCIIC